MGNLDYKPYTERHRPHFNPPDATLFVTCRLAGSVPKKVVSEYKQKKSWLDSQLRRASQSVNEDTSQDVKDWISRIEAYQREWFLKYEDILHRAQTGPEWLKEPEIARIVVKSLHQLDGEAYRLDAFSIMSNHLHIVFKPLLSGVSVDRQTYELVSDDPGLSKIMHSIKGRTARECNLMLGRTGSFWEHESFDRVIRPGKFGKTIRYVLNNPVKAGLVPSWRDWPWNYCREDLKLDIAPI